jgi:hypothetical protein
MINSYYADVYWLPFERALTRQGRDRTQKDLHRARTMNVKDQTRQIAKVREVLSAEIMPTRNEINSWPALAASKRKHELEPSNTPEQD